MRIPRTSLTGGRLITFCAIAAFGAGLVMTAGTADAAKDVTPGCGGLNQGKCGFKKAKKLGKASKLGCKFTPKGRGKAFFDPRKGGQCWSCPRGYKRTVFAVTDKKGRACKKKKGGGYAKAKYHRSVWGCKKGFFDPLTKSGGKLGACWTCPSGYNRTAYSVNDQKGRACKVKAKLTCDAAYGVNKKLNTCVKPSWVQPKNRCTLIGLRKFTGRLDPKPYGSPKDICKINPMKVKLPNGKQQTVRAECRKAITGMYGDYYAADQRCERKLAPRALNKVKAKIDEVAAKHANLLRAFAKLTANPGFSSAQLSKSLKAKDRKGFLKGLRQSPTFRSTEQAADDDRFFRSTTVTLSFDAQHIFGGNYSIGIGFPMGSDEKAKWLDSLGISAGAATGADAGIIIGFWSAEYSKQLDDGVAACAVGGATAAPIGMPLGGSIAFCFDYVKLFGQGKPVFIGFAGGPVAGASAEVELDYVITGYTDHPDRPDVPTVIPGLNLIIQKLTTATQ